MVEVKRTRIVTVRKLAVFATSFRSFPNLLALRNRHALFGAVSTGLLQRQASLRLQNADDLTDIDVRFKLFAFEIGQITLSVAVCQLVHAELGVVIE